MQMTMTQKRKKPRKLFSTGQIAELVGTNPKTVAGWIDKGQLLGVMLPGMVERRVHRMELRKFLESYEYKWALLELDQEEGLAPPPAPRPAPPDVVTPPPPPPSRKKKP